MLSSLITISLTAPAIPEISEATHLPLHPANNTAVSFIIPAESPTGISRIILEIFENDYFLNADGTRGIQRRTAGQWGEVQTWNYNSGKYECKRNAGIAAQVLGTAFGSPTLNIHSNKDVRLDFTAAKGRIAYTAFIDDPRVDYVGDDSLGHKRIVKPSGVEYIAIPYDADINTLKFTGQTLTNKLINRNINIFEAIQSQKKLLK